MILSIAQQINIKRKRTSPSYPSRDVGGRRRWGWWRGSRRSSVWYKHREHIEPDEVIGKIRPNPMTSSRLSRHDQIESDSHWQDLILIQRPPPVELQWGGDDERANVLSCLVLGDKVEGQQRRKKRGRKCGWNFWDQVGKFLGGFKDRVAEIFGGKFPAKITHIWWRFLKNASGNVNFLAGNFPPDKNKGGQFFRGHLPTLCTTKRRQI